MLMMTVNGEYNSNSSSQLWWMTNVYMFYTHTQSHACIREPSETHSGTQFVYVHNKQRHYYDYYLFCSYNILMCTVYFCLCLVIRNYWPAHRLQKKGQTKQNKTHSKANNDTLRLFAIHLCYSLFLYYIYIWMVKSKELQIYFGDLIWKIMLYRYLLPKLLVCFHPLPPPKGQFCEIEMSAAILSYIRSPHKSWCRLDHFSRDSTRLTNSFLCKRWLTFSSL